MKSKKITLDNAFLLANAQIIDYPVVYCNEGFTRLSGYHKSEIMQKSSTCSFMWGDLTDEETKKKVIEAFNKTHAENLEVLIYKKNSTMSIILTFHSLIQIINRIITLLQKRQFGYLCKQHRSQTRKMLLFYFFVHLWTLPRSSSPSKMTLLRVTTLVFIHSFNLTIIMNSSLSFNDKFFIHNII